MLSSNSRPEMEHEGMERVSILTNSNLQIRPLYISNAIGCVI
jgi:hypothetical protein